MNGKQSKYIRTVVKEQAIASELDLPPVRHGVRKIKTASGRERYQFVLHPECLRYSIKMMKQFVAGLNKSARAKPIKQVGFGSRRKRRGQAIRSSIPKFTREGELIHNV